MKVFIYGAGKVGRGLGRAIRRAGWKATVHPARRGLPTRPIKAKLLILAVRDRELGPLAEQLVAAGLVGKKTACVHAAGAATAEVLAKLREVSGGVGQMHPMIAFASPDFTPSLASGQLHVAGDALAEERGRALAKKLKMTARTVPQLDTVGYHAAAGLLANGAAALASVAAKLLVLSGVPEEEAPKMLGPLLRSVAENVEALGFPGALTGPVRRGELAGLSKHYELLKARLPEATGLYLAAAAAQVPLARGIGDAPPGAFDDIEAFLRSVAAPA